MAKRISTFQTSGFRLYCVVGLLFFWGTTWAEVPEKITREATSDALKHDSTTCYFYNLLLLVVKANITPGTFL